MCLADSIKRRMSDCKAKPEDPSIMGAEFLALVDAYDDEEEDVDFDPFQRGSPSEEASSSLSSESEGLGDVAAKNMSPMKPTDPASCCIGDSKNENEEVVMQTVDVEEGPSRMDVGPQKLDDNGSASIHDDDDDDDDDARLMCSERVGTSSSGIDMVDSVSNEELNGLSGVVDMKTTNELPVVDLDAEIPICRRTRAHHSLANYTLDELETFLQESDDEAVLPNVNDEEEYQKFLAAVLLGENGQGEGNNVDEDEDNDADFEIELEEALESDYDNGLQSERHKGQNKRPAHRPETRQKKYQANQKKPVEQTKTSLRPILPSVSSAQMPQFASCEPQWMLPMNVLQSTSSSVQSDIVYGFTAHQISQLYCLIHEHVQLLIQIFSLSVLEPSHQHTASEIQKMLLELADMRDEALTWRRVSYPGVCFRPPYVCPSTSLPSSPFHQMLGTLDNCLAQGTRMTMLYGKYDIELSDSHLSHPQNVEGSSWAPFVSEPVISILDVAPLGLVKTFMDDVSSAVLKYQRCHLASECDKSSLKREPLFSLHGFPLITETVGEVNGVASTVQRKKSLAAEILERSKKQSIAFVPRDIAKLTEKFFPLFNVALFPHKPPPAPVANRVLFTDSEDGLLAMGLMEYNNDWELIQQRFLPCKTKHQIFVRQKNRSSSKAPENPVKVVRRIKTAPLTSEEKALIYEGLKVLKLDWMSIWRLLVPYRDPSLLQRQWRVATGTQKTYKITSDAAKAKRRQYELNRRSRKKALAATQTLSEKEVDSEADNGSDSDTEEEDEAYVHEAFLAEWEPESSKLISTELPSCNLDKSTTDSSCVWPYEKSQTTQQVYSDPARQEDRPIHGSFPSSKSLAHVGYAASSTSNWSMKSPSSRINSQLHRKRRRGVSQVVKLAPDLPPVNLPPSVRVISQSAFKSNSTGAFCSGVVQSGRNDPHLRLPHAAKVDTSVNSGSCKNGSEEQGISLHQPAVESELQLHPLLFRDPENATTSGTMNLFSRTLSQSNLDLFRTPQLSSRQVDHTSSAQSLREMPQNSSTIDFHPLLRRSENVDGLNSVDHPFSDAVLFQNKLGKFSDSPARNSTVPRSTDGQSLATSVSGCLHEKPNELDLDIYLSCAPNKIQRGQSSERNELQSNEFIAGALIHQSAGRSQQANTQLRHCQENLTEAVSVTNSHALRVKNVIRSDIESSASDETRLLDVNDTRMQGHPVRRCFLNPDDQSLPHIVMEQEELSDSDEENGEHVEFECEEMADSEEDELNYEQPARMQNKEGSVMAEEDESPAKDSRTGHHLRPENQNIRFSVIKGTACSSKSGSTEKDKAVAGLIQSRSDPSVLADSTLNPKLESGSLVPTGLHSVPHPLNRSSRKRSSKSSKVQSPDTQKTYISTAATRKAKRSSHRNSPEATTNDRSRDRNICSTDSSDNRHWVDLNLVEKDCLVPSFEATDSASKP